MHIPAMLCGVEQKLRLREGKSLVPGHGASRPKPTPVHPRAAPHCTMKGPKVVFPQYSLVPTVSLKERPLKGGIQNPWYPSSINFSSSWLLNPAVSAPAPRLCEGAFMDSGAGGRPGGVLFGKGGQGTATEALQAFAGQCFQHPLGNWLPSPCRVFWRQI